jgi:hypothetical protein
VESADEKFKIISQKKSPLSTPISRFHHTKKKQVLHRFLIHISFSSNSNQHTNGIHRLSKSLLKREIYSNDQMKLDKLEDDFFSFGF